MTHKSTYVSCIFCYLCRNKICLRVVKDSAWWQKKKKKIARYENYHPKNDSTYQVDVMNCISYHFYRIVGAFTLPGSSSNQILRARFVIFLQILDYVRSVEYIGNNTHFLDILRPHSTHVTRDNGRKKKGN